MSEWTTNADHAAMLRSWAHGYPATKNCHAHAAAVLSAPGVVDLDPEHTAEILTFCVEAMSLRWKAEEADDMTAYAKFMTMLNDCPPYVAEALRRAQR